MGKHSTVKTYTRHFLKFIGAFLEIFFHWLFSLVYSGSKISMPPINDLLLLESATSLAHKIRTRKIKSSEVLQSFIDRINEVNPLLNCVVDERFEEAKKEAQKVDELLASEVFSEEKLAQEKPFLGVPFTTKDCIPVKGLIHSSGLLKRKHIIAEDDAKSITSLRNAGAIPIALTNVSELCMWWESANKVHGRSCNPYDISRIVGGSSGGEGCAQAAAISAFGIGSDIGGSIRMPSFFNGIFGHKPSPCVVSNQGQFPEPVTEEQNRFLGIGPMCRRAEDLLPILKVLTASHKEKLKLDEPVDVRKLKWFYQDNDSGSFMVSAVAPEIKQLFTKVCKHLDKAYGVKVTKMNFERFAKSGPMWFANMKSPNGPSFPQQLANLNGSINPWLELVKWVFRLSEHTFIGIVTCLAEKGGCKYGDEKYEYLVQERNNLRRELTDLLGNDGVFLYPTHPTSAPYHNEPLVKPFNFSYTAVINILGLPATHCPMGLDKNGLPIGIQVIAAENNDRLCLAVAREIEKAFGGWIPPAIKA